MSDKDQFYTVDNIAEQLTSTLRRERKQPALIIEPSAGAGSFCKAIRRYFPKSKLIALDIEPKAKGILKCDFFAFDFTPFLVRPLYVIGNPPFGVNCSLAVSFLNYSIQKINPELIAFIMPRSIKKPTLERRIDSRYSCTACIDIPKDSFVFNGKIKDVNCVWQIWRPIPRIIEPLEPLDQRKLLFVKDPKEADIVVQRTGVRAGKISMKKSEIYKHQGSRCFYLLKCLDSVLLKKIKRNAKFLNMENYEGCHDTVSTRYSISKRDVVKYFTSL